MDTREHSLRQNPLLLLVKRPAIVTLSLTIWLANVCGCAGLSPRVALPSNDQFEREQLRIFSDFRLPRRHRLLDELTARRRDIAERLLLPVSDEPINIYLFDNEKRFQKYLKQNFPLFPQRRAFFVKSDTNLRVFAHWGEHVGDDLRHEVTHGYLHSVIPNLPLWLDEGLAEYFELPRGSNGLHHQHIYHLTEMARQQNWQPSLTRLESLTNAAEMSQLEYAESWLWVHYMLESDMETRKALQDQLARFRMTGDAEPLSHHLAELIEDGEQAVIDHLERLGTKVGGKIDTPADSVDSSPDEN